MPKSAKPSLVGPANREGSAGSQVRTIWECRSVDGRQVVRLNHPAYPDDYRYVNEYQRIIYRGIDPASAGMA